MIQDRLGIYYKAYFSPMASRQIFLWFPEQIPCPSKLDSCLPLTSTQLSSIFSFKHFNHNFKLFSLFALMFTHWLEKEVFQVDSKEAVVSILWCTLNILLHLHMSDCQQKPRRSAPCQPHGALPESVCCKSWWEGQLLLSRADHKLI